MIIYFIFIPYLVFEGYPAGGHDLPTFCTFGCKLLLKTSNTIHVRIVGNDKRFASYLLLANNTLKTFVVPFFGFVLHLLHSRAKCFPTSITSTSKLSIVARGTKDKSILGGKRFVYQRGTTFFTRKAGFMPVHLLVRHVFGIQSNPGLTA